MELEDLVGKHILSGVDEDSKSIERYGSLENCNVINFVLDGTTYSATEDPEDGYRSSMDEIIVSDFTVKNSFAGIEVLGIMRGTTDYSKNDVIDFFDTKNGKLVLSVGTENTDDYYPSFVASFVPENMSVNDLHHHL
jgi:hypothetical protein